MPGFAALQFSALILFLSSSQVIAETYAISRTILTRSVLNYGDPTLFTALVQKLQNRQCIHVAFIGGSITDGHGLPEDALAYPALFEELANENFPCDGRHQVTLYTKGSTASDHWIEFLVGRQEVLLKGVDMVVVDTAVSDVERLPMGPQARLISSVDTIIRDHAEILMHLLLQRSARPDPRVSPLPDCRGEDHTRRWTGAAVLWLGTSTRRSSVWRDGALPRATDGVYAQLPAAVVHGVPYISVLDALGPFDNAASETWLNNTWYTDPVENVNPGPWGHVALARAIVHFLHQAQLSLEQPPWDEPQLEPYCPRPPAFVTDAALAMHLDSAPLHIPTVSRKATAPRLRGCDGWAMRPGGVGDRAGLEAGEVGARCSVVAFPEQLAQRQMRVGEARVMLLQGREGMGVVRVTVATAPAVPLGDGSGETDCVVDSAPGAAAAAGGGEGSKMTVLGSKDIDCLPGEGGLKRGGGDGGGGAAAATAELRVDSFRVKVPAGGVGPEECLVFTLEVLESGRKENNVKIQWLTVF